MTVRDEGALDDTGERMIPPAPGEVSFVWERHRFAYALAAQRAAGRRVLDVGCGTGYGSHLLAQSATAVLALDHDPDAIAYCRRHYSAPNLEFRVLDAQNLVLDAEFDLTLSFQVVEHLPDPGQFLRGLARLTAPGGTVMVTTPNVRTPATVSGNPFHVSEMNAEQFARVARDVFSRFELYGVGYARPNRLRRLIQQTPVYRLGRRLRRNSALKRVADRALDLRTFRVLTDRVAEDAIDLLLIGEKESGNTRNG